MNRSENLRTDYNFSTITMNEKPKTGGVNNERKDQEVFCYPRG